MTDLSKKGEGAAGKASTLDASFQSAGKPLMLDPSSMYYLSSADNPGAIITPVTWTGENYAEWAKSVKNALRAKKKLGFIEGKVLKPDDEAP